MKYIVFYISYIAIFPILYRNVRNNHLKYSDYILHFIFVLLGKYSNCFHNVDQCASTQREPQRERERGREGGGERAQWRTGKERDSAAPRMNAAETTSRHHANGVMKNNRVKRDRDRMCV